MMVSGKINLTEGATYSEEMNFFMTTQRELMQDCRRARAGRGPRADDFAGNARLARGVDGHAAAADLHLHSHRHRDRSRVFRNCI